MRYLHTMVRVKDLEASLHFYCNLFGLQEIRRYENEKGRFTLVFLTAEKDLDRAKAEMAPCLELTYNWDTEDYTGAAISVTWPTRSMISMRSARS